MFFGACVVSSQNIGADYSPGTFYPEWLTPAECRGFPPRIFGHGSSYLYSDKEHTPRRLRRLGLHKGVFWGWAIAQPQKTPSFERGVAAGHAEANV